MKTKYHKSNEHEYMCILSDKKGNQFIGYSKCHPEDYDFESEKIGYTIAYLRANIKYLKHIKKYEINKTLKVCQTLVNEAPKNIKIPYFLKKKVTTYTEKKKKITDKIQELENELKNYISTKDAVREKIRKIRKKNDKKRRQSNRVKKK